MIDRLRGKLLAKDFGRVVVETGGGLGLFLKTPLSTSLALPEIGKEVSLFTRLVLREESIELFGFLTNLEKESFDILTSVTRIGPRLALTIISAIGPAELAQALATQDIAKLSAIKGIGLKTAERLMVELKDKAQRLSDLAETLPGGPALQAQGENAKTLRDEASQALQSLGYTRAEADKAVKSAAAKDKALDSVENLIREALKAFGN
ncbi:MAG: Holliday junction branch migration protein RuvA [Deltaproteobacteria bacterium]|jgi:Holliday junction DNA helicase RuvA|nr:Holliday junction branch migration protein RuvA [Deltaproteobacteria bacterium]